MIVSTPYTECYIKKSFLSGQPNYHQDKTIFAVLIAIRFVRGRAPLYVCYIPSIGAIYDKVDQCAIFQTSETPDERIDMQSVGWWDCLSDKWQLIQVQALRGMWIASIMRDNKKMEGEYLWTCDPQVPSSNDYGQAGVWHEHKTKTYFWDQDTGALVCAPNNKMRLYDSSLSPEELDSPSWLKVYKDLDSPSRKSHEGDQFFGHSDQFNYE